MSPPPKSVSESQSTIQFTVGKPVPDNPVTAELTDQFPITLKQGKVGEVSITQVEFLADKTLLHYEVRGEDPFSQANVIFLRDVNGEYIYPLKPTVLLHVKDSYSFTREFPSLSKDQIKQLATQEMEPPNFVHELEMKVPLE